ncbi:MAG: flagellar biosynthesis protein FlhB [Phycisphaeraceae bacterium]
MPDHGDKTEQATPRRQAEARDEGNIARSQDLAAAVSLFGAVLLLGTFGLQLFGGFRALVQNTLGGDWGSDPASIGDLSIFTALSTRLGLTVLAPFALGLFALGIIANVAQFGFVLTAKPLTPKLSKLSPLKGFSNLFSKRSAIRLVMALGKIAIVCFITGQAVYENFPKLASLMRLDTGPMVAAVSAIVYALALKIAVVLLVLAILDFAYQKWQHGNDLKMSKEEVKEEMKRMEGDPLIKQRRAKIARQLAMQRIASAVPKADVIVTNPTHFAIALKYDETMAAPKVVAKGADFMAMRIRQLAALHHVPIVERPPLARALYQQVEVGQEIPVEYYAAVAEILAYVYRINTSQQNKQRRAGIAAAVR